MPPSSDPAPETPSEPSSSLVGTRIHKYEIVRVLGRGGMGTVYEALNTAIGKRVAMKFVDGDTAKNQDAVARFQREAQAASAVESAHIVEIFDSGVSEDGQPYIVMELMRGEDLGHRIQRCGRLDIPEAINITVQILRGLHRAHEAGIVHRDLKPDNVFLVERDDDQDFAKILDFGISKIQRRGETPVNTLTRQGTVLGTPFYMSPEQAQALSDVDGRTDLWSVGAILFECLTGRVPYSGQTYEQVIISICTKDADDVRLHNPEVNEGLAQVVAKALHRERDGRFPSARAFLDGIASAAGGLISSRRQIVDEISSISRPTPIKKSDPAPSAFEPTVELQVAGTSRVGWSTNSSRDLARRRERARFVAVGVLALLLGVVGAIFFLRPRREVVVQAATATTVTVEAERPEVSIKLSATVPSARFLVDGVELAGGMLTGPKGTTRRVDVEAAGYATKHIEVTLGPTAPDPIELDPADAPKVAPAQEAPVPGGETDPRRNKAVPGGAKAAPPKTAAPSPPVPPPPPTPTTPRGGMHMHRD